jgi:hypothetical protein
MVTDPICRDQEEEGAIAVAGIPFSAIVRTRFGNFKRMVTDGTAVEIFSVTIESDLADWK